MKKAGVIIVVSLMIFLSFLLMQRFTGFAVYNKNIVDIEETFIQDINVKNAKFYDTNNNGMVDRVELKNRFTNIKINPRTSSRVIIKLKNDKILVKELNKNEINNLLQNTNVESVTLDSKFNLTLQDTAGILNVSFLHFNNITGSDSVCVLDSGIYRHDDLKFRMLNEKCFADDDISGDGIGYCSGAEESDSADDEIGHGTLVAGIVGASGGITGIAPGTKFVIVKVCDRYGQCSYSDLIKGINYCTDNKERYNISVITLSLGTGYVYADLESCNLDNIEVTNAINGAYANGIFIDSSSGNSGSSAGISAPACLANITSVGATTKSDAIASYSNKGVLLDVLAPGSNVNTTSCIGPYALCSSSGYTDRYSGTSFSSPHAAGAAILLTDYSREKYNYNLNPGEIRDILKESGVRIFYGNASYPRIDLFMAARYIDNLMNESILVWNDLDSTKELYYYKEYLENITFYARPTLKMQVVNISCTLDLENNTYNLSLNENKSAYEFSKQINEFKDYNFTIFCSNLSSSSIIHKEDFDFYLNRTFKFEIKNQLNEPLSNVNLSIYEFNETNAYNLTISDEGIISLSEFLVVDSGFMNKTPHRLVLSYENETIERSIMLNDSMSDLFIFNTSIIENISEQDVQPATSSGGGGGSGEKSREEQKYELQENKEEIKQEPKEIASEETRILEKKEEPAQQEVQKDGYNISLLGLAVLFLLVLVKKLFMKKI